MLSANVNLSRANLRDLRSAKSEWSARLLRATHAEGFRALAAAAGSAPDQNVVGVAVGEKLADGKPTGVLAVKFYVRVKYLPHELPKKHLLPTTIHGLPVDVEETGLLRRLAGAAGTTMPDPKTKMRPAQPGGSVGFRDPQNRFRMAGTFGALVKNSAGQFVLSNNHVLADEGRLPQGAPIFQPGLLDGGNPKTDQIAVLTQFIPLSAAGNKVDCAIAKVKSNNLVSNSVLHIGPPKGTATAAIDLSVHKFGRTTSYTVGRVTSIDADVIIEYETGRFTFAEQITIVGRGGEPFSAAGDSGSLILERTTNKAVGLLFAGSNTHTIADPIADVLSALDVTLA